MNNKTALWLFEISTDFDKPEWLKKIARAFLPRCEYRHWETKAECHNPGEPCCFPNWNDEKEDHIEWVCFEHTVGAGFCRSCGQFCAGIESFDFGDYAGYCDNCASELEAEDEREEQEDFENEYEIGYP